MIGVAGWENMHLVHDAALADDGQPTGFLQPRPDADMDPDEDAEESEEEPPLATFLILIPDLSTRADMCRFGARHDTTGHSRHCSR